MRGYSSLENDEAIAQTLQDEEGSERFHDWGEHSYTDTWGPDYDASSTYEYDSEQESDSGGVPEISDDFAVFDGEVGRRLNNMDSIPHVPRINGEIPTLDDASAAHQRLLNRYELNQLIIVRKLICMSIFKDGDKNEMCSNDVS